MTSAGSPELKPAELQGLDAVLREHLEPIHVPSPSVPRGDQHAHKRAAGVGDEQASGHLGEQPVDILDPIGGRLSQRPQRRED